MLRPSANSLAEVLDASRREERRRALRALLARPVLFDREIDSGNHRGTREAQFLEDAFVLVRRHADYLGHWIARYTGWTLIIRADSARLVKHPVNTEDATRMAVNPGSSGGPLSRSHYVLWCLMLTVMHEEGRQTTLKRLAEQSIRLAETMPELAKHGCEYNLKSASTRRAIVCVVRLAIRYGVLHRVGGEEEHFGQNDTVDCLYNIHPGLLTDLLSLPNTLLNDTGESPHEPDRILSDSESVIEAVDQTRFFERRLESLLDPLGREGEDSLRPRELEHRLIRRLIDDPVVYFDELNEREYQYFQSQRSRLFEVIESAIGLVPELRREGVAMLDPTGDLTDVKMPDSGTVGHATLLMAEFLSQQLTSNEEASDAGIPPDALSRETLLAHLSSLAETHQSNWRKGITELAQLKLLLDDCLGRLEMLRMIRFRRNGSVIALPAIHRFVADQVSIVTS